MGSSDWVWEVDADGAYTYTSPIVQEILGYRPNDKWFETKGLNFKIEVSGFPL